MYFRTKKKQQRKSTQSLDSKKKQSNILKTVNNFETTNQQPS